MRRHEILSCSQGTSRQLVSGACLEWPATRLIDARARAFLRSATGFIGAPHLFPSRWYNTLETRVEVSGASLLIYKVYDDRQVDSFLAIIQSLSPVSLRCLNVRRVSYRTFKASSSFLANFVTSAARMIVRRS